MFLLEAIDAKNFCTDAYKLMDFLHNVLVIFKIVVPILLIVFGMVDLGKAVVSSDEKAIKSSTSSLLKKVVAALFIFFLPTIVSAIVNLTGEKDANGNLIGSSGCIKCVTEGKCAKDSANPTSCYIDENGKYIGKDGKEVTKTKYDADCK